MLFQTCMTDFLLWKVIFWRTVSVPIVFNYFGVHSLEGNGNQNCLVTNISKYHILCTTELSQKDLEQHDENLQFGVNYPIDHLHSLKEK